MHGDSMLILFGSFGWFVSLFQIGTVCFIGEWLRTKSIELFEATYDCIWFEQSKSFKKSLMIMRFVCQRELNVGVVRFGFSHESFYAVSENLIIISILNIFYRRILLHFITHITDDDKYLLLLQ